MANQSISDIKTIFKNTPIEKINETIDRYSSDERQGVQNMITQYTKKSINYYKEIERIHLMKHYEQANDQYNHICGIDEAGRGPLAGPVISGAVILSQEEDILYLNDSKKLSEKKRNELYGIIKEKAVSYSVGIATVETIDTINILQATFESMKDAINKLSFKPDYLLIDAITLPNIDIRQQSIIKGDAKSVSIAAASILAKVTRDKMMAEYHTLYPEYNFLQNKGYGTSEHIEAIKKYGPCPIHRQTFIKNFI
ncbi:RNase HII [Natranaerovirga hydrolytica]|uniref:Ribonuclease HII n=1 Tax=Natranaerovirga hydrolytica TaxID=680378 RepID=A0A4R1N088_9FIRM|nr:ribonuclease HII [Natranaerovirga hydrolytica]TCK98300.1 RNase HII [Natranaerovirga hydrolytica]